MAKNLASRPADCGERRAGRTATRLDDTDVSHEMLDHGSVRASAMLKDMHNG